MKISPIPGSSKKQKHEEGQNVKTDVFEDWQTAYDDSEKKQKKESKEKKNEHEAILFPNAKKAIKKIKKEVKKASISISEKEKSSKDRETMHSNSNLNNESSLPYSDFFRRRDTDAELENVNAVEKEESSKETKFLGLEEQLIETKKILKKFAKELKKSVALPLHEIERKNEKCVDDASIDYSYHNKPSSKKSSEKKLNNMKKKETNSHSDDFHLHISTTNPTFLSSVERTSKKENHEEKLKNINKKSEQIFSSKSIISNDRKGIDMTFLMSCMNTLVIGVMSINTIRENSTQQREKGKVIPLYIAGIWVIISFLCGFTLCYYHLMRKETLETKKSAANKQEKISRSHSGLLSTSIDVLRTSLGKSSKDLQLPQKFHTNLLQTNENKKRVASENFMQMFLKHNPFFLNSESNGINGNSTTLESILSFRGKDVFLTGKDSEPLREIYNNPFLIKCGLRSKPVFIINVIVGWGNVVIYLNLPNWIKNFQDIAQHPKDDNSTKALKQFLKGDNEYKNNHFKIVSSLVEGPRIVKFMTPKNREMLLTGSYLGLKWKYQNQYIHRDSTNNEIRHAVLEMTCDVASNSLLRQISSYVKRFCDSLLVDTAFCIYDDHDEGGNICLDSMQLGQVDFDSCPIIPPFTEKMNLEEAQSIMRESLT